MPLPNAAELAYHVCMSLKVIALGTGVCADTSHTLVSRQPPGFLLDIDGMYLLFDCSEGIRFRLKNVEVDISQVTHVAVSHAHPDHAALPQFIQSKFVRNLYGASDPRATELYIYLPHILARDFPQVWNWHQPENAGRYWDDFVPEIIGMEDGFAKEISASVTLRARSVYHGHGRHPAMGFRVETPDGIIAYTGDTGVCDNLKKIAEDTDLLIADCQTRVGQEYTGGYGHMGPRQCGELALRSGVKELWLTHYYDFDTSDAMLAEVRAAGYFGKTILAVDGMVWQSTA